MRIQVNASWIGPLVALEYQVIKMNTQGMTLEGNLAPWARGSDMREVGPMPVVKHTIFTPEEVEELKQIIRDTYKDLHRGSYPY